MKPRGASPSHTHFQSVFTTIPLCFLVCAQYLQLKARGRVSVMFGDASLTPEERAAKNAALKNRANRPTANAACGPDIPGAFNVGGPAGAASDACAAACGGNLADVVGLQLLVNRPSTAAMFSQNGQTSMDTKPSFIE